MKRTSVRTVNLFARIRQVTLVPTASDSTCDTSRIAAFGRNDPRRLLGLSAA